ncbi:MAG TPA: DHH family phosphoesterase, partial [Thermoleophilaceae bacterium]
MPADVARWSAAAFSFAEADAISRELGLSPTVASILVRRGLSTPAEARGFLAGAERHDPFLLGDMRTSCELILGHVARGSPIVVHGDYDVDGVSSTAILVRALRRLGARVSWHLPSRMEEGYGVSAATIERLAGEGAGLLVTVDCGITAAAEVDRALELGLEVVVTDHHRPPERLPACPIVHPAIGGYPCPDLCAAGVAHKLAEALYTCAGEDPAQAAEDSDIVALATVADLVPLRGENRRLVREGLEAMARTRRPGLRALMKISQLDPGDVDARALAFRLAPRINAAGRLQRADAGLELLLTDDDERAAQVADELDLLNRERQDTETRIMFAAEAERARHDGEPAYVLAGEGWHPGVIGIVASRIVERHHRPTLLIALDGESGRGSGRS